jgi:hypothetical protein
MAFAVSFIAAFKRQRARADPGSFAVTRKTS